MDVEFGIRDIERPVQFSTDQSVDEVSQAVTNAITAGQPVTLTDSKGRRIIVPANALGYAVIGSETKHAVGFGAL
ncbi:Protein of unknown function [Bifidobacterium bohemicum]|uniref:Putative ATP-binding protein n=1 Tax=Bifidobacterium bohemicum DSM 22767 TaxID=1437606 RepID=A0A086ZGK1_9BIFI|nr:DUF3107 domain-containing protein [Bifidobacterium bohemicum]KFI45651.1 putative ATP-binding protein [Bifidobacterium bohemicum DSM 22767]SCB99538.1 Protein of unknown function [Bifidobacterium bohemicum]